MPVPNATALINVTSAALASVVAQANGSSEVHALLTLAGPFVAAIAGGAAAVALGTLATIQVAALVLGTIVVSMLTAILISTDLTVVGTVAEEVLGLMVGMTAQAVALAMAAVQALTASNAVLASFVQADLHLNATSELLGMTVNGTVNLTKFIITDVRFKQDVLIAVIFDLDPQNTINETFDFLVNELPAWVFAVGASATILASDILLFVNDTIAFLNGSFVPFVIGQLLSLVQFLLSQLAQLGVPTPAIVPPPITIPP